MTMQIKIDNLDLARTAQVEVQDFNIHNGTVTVAERFSLSPGEARTVYIHAARSIQVTEDAMAMQPLPPSDAAAPRRETGA